MQCFFYKQGVDSLELMDFFKNLTQPSKTKTHIGTQESLEEAIGHLSQASHVEGFDPSQQNKTQEAIDFLTPLSQASRAVWTPPTLKDVEVPEDKVKDSDYTLVFVPEESWAKLVAWSSSNT